MGTVLSADGATGVYFAVNAAGDACDLYVQNIATGTSTLVAAGSDTAGATSLTLSRTGRYLGYYDGTTIDNQYAGQIWAADLLTGQRLLVDSGSAKRVGTGLTADGSELAFSSYTRQTGGEGPFQVFVAYLGAADTSAPPPGWSVNPKTVTPTATLTVPATDSGSGVAGGEYWLGDTDPGTTMTWDGTNLSASFGTGLAPGVYRVNVRARDVAGNWSAATVDYLVVYDPNGPSVSGKKTVVPSLAGGDVLLGLVGHSPYSLAADAHEPDPDKQPERRQELQVRLTAQRLLRDHTRLDPNEPEAATYWRDQQRQRMNLDLTGAGLVDLDLAYCQPATVTVTRAQFHGHAYLSVAQLHARVDLRGAQFHGTAYLREAKSHCLAGLSAWATPNAILPTDWALGTETNGQLHRITWPPTTAEVAQPTATG